jgi:CBS domain-containing protein
MSTIGQICVREVVTAAASTNVATAARLMRDHHVGSLVIVEERDGAKRPVGIVTDRDIVIEVTALDLDARDITVGELMGLGVTLVTARDSDGIRETLELMRHHGLRRIPIVNWRGNLVGIVAVDDIMKVLADDLAAVSAVESRERARETAQRRPISA